MAVVFGTAAMRLEHVPAALTAATRSNGPTTIVRALRPHVDRASFLRDVAGTRDDAQICLVVPAETPWSPYWVWECADAKRKLRFVFTGDASHAWRCHVQEPDVLGRAIPVETLAPLSVTEIEDQLRRNASSTDDTRAAAERIHRSTGGFLLPFGAIFKPDLARGLDRFSNSDLRLADYGVPTMPAARDAVSALLTYTSPSENVRLADLQSIAAETGVDGVRLRDWLLALGLAEPGASADQLGGEEVCLNPILCHSSVLRELGVTG
jgi:hypothetical protein